MYAALLILFYLNIIQEPINIKCLLFTNFMIQLDGFHSFI